MYRQTANIFTKPLGLDNMRLFSSVLGLQHLDIPNLRGGNIERSNGRDEEIRSKSDKASDFRTTEEAKDGYGGSNQRNEPKPETTEQGGDKAMKVRTKTWSDAVKGPKEDELEEADSVAKSNPYETDPMKAKRTRRQQKPTLIRRNRRYRVISRRCKET